MVGASCGKGSGMTLACFLGNLSSICFFVVYVPQFILNYRRKSMEGFSIQSMMIKVIGASFLFVNSLYNDDGFPVFLYGFLNSLQHMAFFIQFWMYAGDSSALIYCAFPVVPLILGYLFPQSVKITSMVKPITQIVSHIPQLIKCAKTSTTKGISMFGQHLNFIGAILGMLMCVMNKETSLSTWLLYVNSMFQAVSIYLLAFLYGEMRWLDTPNKPVESDMKPLL